ncbi:Fe-S cluster biogenesis protein NfuA, 4Fe-4S-binding domain [Tistlia consotensis]|uniref:Fe-S cluster biogenesis protein NfuA, 4Fe-4S-binding domain n=1 Tax=Tistlia consotensis USBA 355 TaxID=560819 RepID=A0A1Y6C1G9_9PROT|nr:NifU family protein [Tistlia consotensis]SMF30652.1 Fe-S cluster biogenesis protein NfuA, 4Fe-4S-binding domain [Tistlia consotensis USBA 355]SNS19833.1 Fe-S cluster biogenesis protein NfuA, 4Fe-4S-binding domain [Tistlia consotensis]
MARPAESVASAQTEERGLDALLRDVAALEALGDDWPEAQRRAAEARVRAVDALNAEAFRRLIRALKDLPGSAAVLREAAADEVVYAVLRRHGILKPSVFERVEAALDGIRPTLAGHGGDVELVSVEPPLAEVRFLGACDGCPASMLTFHAGVTKAIREGVPEIVEVRQVKSLGGGTSDSVHFTSPFAAGLSDGWRLAVRLAELPDGATRAVELEGRSLLLSRFGERVTCFENACAHLGLPLDDGEIEAGLITCAHHGFRYSLESGECLTAPEVQLQPHAVRVVGDRIDVRLTE